MRVIQEPIAEQEQAKVSSRPAARSTSAVLRLYPALANSAYRLLWLGMLPATLAVMMNQVTSPYTAFTLSDSASVLGVVSLAQGLPMLLLGLVGGVAADRLPRRLVLIGSQTTLGLAAAALAALGLTGGLQVWHVVAASFIQGAAFAFNMPARQAYIAELVGRPLLASAVALNNAGQNFCRVAGPALAGVLLALPGLGITATFLVIAAMYGIALSALIQLPTRARPVGPSSAVLGSSRAQLTEGLRYVRSSPAILTLIGMNLVVVVFGMPYQTLMPVVAERVFGVGATGLGLLMAGSGAGALAGAVAVAALSRFRRPAALQLGLGIALGLALALFAATRLFPLAVALLVVVGFLFSSFSVINNTLLMANTEPRLTGRVMSVYLLTWAAMPLGAVPLAWLADWAGAPVALALAGGIIAAIVAALALVHPASHRIGWTP
jgi:MFS family permease